MLSRYGMAGTSSVSTRSSKNDEMPLQSGDPRMILGVGESSHSGVDGRDNVVDLPFMS